LFALSIGAALARLEGRIAFETIFDRLGDMELTDDQIPMIESTLLRGPRALPLKFRPIRTRGTA